MIFADLHIHIGQSLDGKYVKITGAKTDRLLSISDRPMGKQNSSTYVHQVPLKQLPGIGPKMYTRLLKAFGTEMAILHYVDEVDLAKVAGEKVARWIIKARQGDLIIEAGGGGIFGRVVDILSL